MKPVVYFEGCLLSETILQAEQIEVHRPEVLGLLDSSPRVLEN
jgi:hypothetical protein